MVRIRLKRTGRRNRPAFRLTAVDGRATRDGHVVEELGLYDPANKNPDMQCRLNAERIQYWLSNGAQPSDTARDLLKKIGLKVAGRK
jgi:small subunit ribosomal protein S16